MYATRTIYEQYGAMLLGYIYEVLKDRELAEKYLLEVFSNLPQELKHHLPHVNVYLQLQLMARKLLIARTDTTFKEEASLPAKANRFLQQMPANQQLIFCRVYYHGQSIAQVAASLNKSETEIRQTLKEAFATIRKIA